MWRVPPSLAPRPPLELYRGLRILLVVSGFGKGRTREKKRTNINERATARVFQTSFIKAWGKKRVYLKSAASGYLPPGSGDSVSSMFPWMALGPLQAATSLNSSVTLCCVISLAVCPGERGRGPMLG